MVSFGVGIWISLICEILHLRKIPKEFPRMNTLVARNAEDVEVAYSILCKASAIGCDTETSSLNAKYGKLLSIQFSDGQFNVLVPISEGVSIDRLVPVLSDPSITKIFHNARFDLDFLAAADIRVANVFDTMLAEKVLTRGANQSASLADTLYRYFAVDLEKSHRTRFSKSWNGIWTDELVEYALSDVAHLPALMREQKSWIQRLGLEEEYTNQIEKLVSLVSSF